jgi:hypothetical protein
MLYDLTFQGEWLTLCMCLEKREKQDFFFIGLENRVVRNKSKENKKLDK